MAMIAGLSVVGPALTGEPASGAALPAAGATNGSASTVWLCRPGLAENPCTADLTTTVIRANGSRSVVHASAARHPAVDCFYVYPTVSLQPTTNANLHIEYEEQAAAVAQAARFSQVCRVYAPIYRQITESAVSKGNVPQSAVTTAYTSLQSAWNDYLLHYNHGRGIVLIGHSQGASLLITLMQQEIDNQPLTRDRLVSAIILGGNVTVPTGRDVGGDFEHIPACTSTVETGCVVAYSSYDQPPPFNSLFGRVATGFGAQPTAVGLQVLCTNPASLGGGSGALSSYFPTRTSSSANLSVPGVNTPWVTFPGLYSARCASAGAQPGCRSTTGAAKGQHPIVRQFDGPQWGLHVYDVNIALGNLVGLVRTEAQAYSRHVSP